jgi:hypothetical protein
LVPRNKEAMAPAELFAIASYGLLGIKLRRTSSS